MLGYYHKDIITASNSGATGESLYKNKYSLNLQNYILYCTLDALQKDQIISKSEVYRRKTKIHCN